MSFLIPGEVTFGREEEVQRRMMAAAPSPSGRCHGNSAGTSPGVHTPFQAAFQSQEQGVEMEPLHSLSSLTFPWSRSLSLMSGRSPFLPPPVLLVEHNPEINSSDGAAGKEPVLSHSQ